MFSFPKTHRCAPTRQVAVRECPRARLSPLSEGGSELTITSELALAAWLTGLQLPITSVFLGQAGAASRGDALDAGVGDPGHVGGYTCL